MLDIHMALGTDADLNDEETFVEYRKQLREKLLAEALIDPSSPGTTITAEFSGSDDSGNWSDWDKRMDHALVKHFFSHLLETKVTWDWYNNDGGGGTIEWNLQEDVISITGYWNEMVSNDVDGVTL